MKFGPQYKVPFRRRREGKTDYRKRLKLLLSGKPRLVVRLTNRRVICQVMGFDAKGDRTLELQKLGWKGGANTSAAYLAGYLCAKKALKAEVKEAVLDIGLYTPTKGGRVFAALKGALDGGLIIHHNPEVLPPEERIRGKHVEEYAQSLSPELREKRFSELLGRGLNPEEFSKHFEEFKTKLENL
jgi:large subunit ribosomal protein L18